MKKITELRPGTYFALYEGERLKGYFRLTAIRVDGTSVHYRNSKWYEYLYLAFLACFKSFPRFQYSLPQQETENNARSN